MPRQATNPKRSLEPAAEAYAAGLVRRGLHAMLKHADGVREADFDAVHDMRVASRRLRAVLSVFGADFAGHAGEELERRVKGVTRALGEARDLDVQLERLQRLSDALPEQERTGMADLIGDKRSERSRLDSIVRKSMDRLTERDLEGDFEKRSGLASSGADGTSDGATTDSTHAEAVSAARDELLPRAETMIANRVADLRRYEPYVEDPERIDELHCMRIEAKRLRYTLEIFAPFVGQAATSAITEVKSLQTQLGDVHDADVMLP